MNLDCSNASSSSDEDFKNDTTFNNNSSDSGDSNGGNEIIPPSPKQGRKNSTNKNPTLSRSHENTNNANSVEYGTHETLDTTVTQNIQPISTRPMESSETTTIQHHQDYIQISTPSTSCEQIVQFNLTKTREKINRPKSSDWNQISKIHSRPLHLISIVMKTNRTCKIYCIDILHLSQKPNWD